MVEMSLVVLAALFALSIYEERWMGFDGDSSACSRE